MDDDGAYAAVFRYSRFNPDGTFTLSTSHLLPAREEARGDRRIRWGVEDDQRDHPLEVGLVSLVSPGPVSGRKLADRERQTGGALAQRSAAMERDQRGERCARRIGHAVTKRHLHDPVDPKWDPCRADPRFLALLARCDFMRTAPPTPDHDNDTR